MSADQPAETEHLLSFGSGGSGGSGPRLIATATNKTYDGSTNATGSLSVQGLLGSDVLSASASGASFDTKDVGTGKTVTFAGLSLSGDPITAANYSLGSTSAITTTGAIAPAGLKVIARSDAKFVTQTDAVGSSNATAGYNGYQFSGFVGGETDTVLGNPTITVSRTGIADPTVLGASSVEAAGSYSNALMAAGPATAGNYALSYEAADFTIVPAGQLLVKTAGGSSVYGSGAAAPAISSVAYLNPSGNTISSLTLSNGPDSNGLYTFSDGVSGTVSFALTPTGASTTLSTSGNTRVGSYAYSVTGLSQSGTNLSNTNNPVATGDLVVTPKAATLTAASNAFTYNGATQNQASSFTGLIAADLVQATGLASAKNVGSYGSSLGVSGADAANYSVAFSDHVITIAPKALSIIGGTSSLTYNATTQTNTTTASVSGLVSGESVTISGYGAGRNVGTYSDVLVATAGANTNLDNYTITTVNGALTITPYQLSFGSGASGPRIEASATNKVYDATTNGSGSLSVNNLLGSDALTAAAANVSFDSKDVGTRTATFTGISLSGDPTTLANYGLGQTPSVTATATIAPATLQVLVQSDAKFVTLADPTGYNGYQFSGLVAGETAGVLGNPTITIGRSVGGEAAGVYSNALVATGPATAGNYALSYQPADFTIVPAGQLLVKTAGGNGVYGAGPVTPTISSVAYLNPSGNTISSLTLSSGPSATGLYTYTDGAGGTVSFTLTPTGASTTLSTSGNTRVGSYAYSVSDLSQSGTNLNNTSNPVATGDLLITPKAVTLSANTDAFVYNGASQSQGFSFSGLISGDLVQATGLASAKDVGSTSSALGVSGVDASNYTVAYSNSSLTITPRALSIGGGASTLTYNAASQTNSTVASVSGLVSGENITISGYGSGRNVGTYSDALVATAGANTTLSNYAITISNGALTITPYQLNFGSGATGPRIEATANGKTYDASTNAGGSLSVLGLLGSDVLSAGAGSASFDTPNVGSGKIITFSGISLGGDATTVGNYSLGPAPSVTSTAAITPAPLTVAIQNDAKFFNQSDPTGYNGYQYSGFVGGETASVLGSPAITIVRSVSGESAGTYSDALTAASSSPTTVGNYTLTYQPGTFTIVPAGQLLVKTTGDSSVYGSGPVAPTITSVAYLVSGSTVSTLSLASGPSASGLYTYTDGAGGSVSFTLTPLGASTTLSSSGNTRVGSYAYSVTNLTQTGSNLSNTNAPVATGNLLVTPRAASLTASTESHVYNGAIQTQGSSFTGLLGGDLVQATGVATARNVGAYGSALGVSGVDTSNYSFTYINSSLTITPFHLNFGGTPSAGSPGIITAATTKTYDGTNAATGSLIPVLFAGDTLTASASSISFNSAAAASGKPVTFEGITLNGDATTLANYLLPSGVTAAATATITAATLTVTADARSKMYATDDPGLTYTVSGLVAGDTTSAVLSGALSRAQSGTLAGEQVGRYRIGQGSLIANSNYVTQYTSADLTIRPRSAWTGPGPWPGPGPAPTPLIVSATTASKMQGASDPALAYTVSGLVNVTLANGVVIHDTAASVLSGALRRDAGERVGGYAINQGSLTANSNYSFNLEPGTFTIMPLELEAPTLRQNVLQVNAGQVQNNQVIGNGGPDSTIQGNTVQTGIGQRFGPPQPNFTVQTQRSERYEMGRSELQIDPGEEVCVAATGCGGVEIRGIDQQTDAGPIRMKQARWQSLTRWLMSHF
ncbi:MAG: Heme/hemopexin-binding protein precursor [Cyanobacteriota bacterium]